MNVIRFPNRQFISTVLLINIWIILSRIFVLNKLYASEIASNITEALVNQGFENVRVAKHNNHIFASIENSLYRSNANDIANALDIISENSLSGIEFHLYALKHDIPKVLVIISRDNWVKIRQSNFNHHNIDDSLIVSYDLAYSWKYLKNIKPKNPHTFKSDLVLYPQIKLRNVYLRQLYEAQFNLAPAWEFSLWKGMKFTGQCVVPVFNEYKEYSNEGDFVRPGFLTTSQSLRLPGSIFTKATIGNFSAHRFGGDLNILYPVLDGFLDVEFQTGITGKSWFSKNKWYTTSINTITWFLKTRYFAPIYNLRFDLSYGKYLYGDQGIRADLSRFFNETVIGFYAMQTSGELNGGFHFAIPIFPSNRGSPKIIRLQLPKYFDWEYNAGTEFTLGRYYETQPNENRYEHFSNPNFIKKQLLKLKSLTR